MSNTAEAGKDVADFIFALLAMPVGAVESLVRAADVLATVRKRWPTTRTCRAQSLGNAYSYTRARPRRGTRTPRLFLPPPEPSVLHMERALNPGGRATVRHAARSRFPEGGNKGPVQGEQATYIVMDDLTVTTANVLPAALLKEFGGGVEDIDALEERTVDIGNEEALRILKAALHSSTVLTDAFIPQEGRGATGEEEERVPPRRDLSHPVFKTRPNA
ncbi:unnamed protein product [Urochloa humidicola]